MLCSALPPPLVAGPIEAGEASEVRFGRPGEGGSEGGEGWGDEEAALDAPPPPPPPHAAAPSPYELELEADALEAALEAGAQRTFGWANLQLPPRHRALLALAVARDALRAAGKLPLNEWSVFVRSATPAVGGARRRPVAPHSELPLSMYKPLGAEAVGRLEAMLTEMPYLAGGGNSVCRAAFFEPGGGPFGELEEWRRMAEAAADEPGALPKVVAKALTPWRALLLRQAVRPHALLAAVAELVRAVLGAPYAAPPPTAALGRLLGAPTGRGPQTVLLLLPDAPAGMVAARRDLAAEVEALGAAQSPPVRVQAAWLPAGCDAREAAGLVEQCAVRGGWLLLQRVELLPPVALARLLARVPDNRGALPEMPPAGSTGDDRRAYDLAVRRL